MLAAGPSVICNYSLGTAAPRPLSGPDETKKRGDLVYPDQIDQVWAIKGAIDEHSKQRAQMPR